MVGLTTVKSQDDRVRNVRRYQRVFFERYGPPPWPCHECGELITEYGRGLGKGNIHHLDDDFTNDAPENLVPIHLECHHSEHPITDEQRASIRAKLTGRPSPTKGMTFGPETRAKQSAAVARRFAEMSSIERANWLARTIAGMRDVDKSPANCDCGAGPFRGAHGLALHVARAHEMDQTPVKCECGSGPFKGASALATHVGLTHNGDPRDRTPLTCYCGAGPFRGPSGLNIHVNRTHDVEELTCECGKGPYKGAVALGRHKASRNCAL